MANLKDLIVNGSARILGTIYGNVTGNVTGNVSGSSGSCTGNAATATKATQDASGNNIVNTYATKTALNDKQATLVSGTNIKTINGTSLLGSGNITVNSAPDLDGTTISKNSSNKLQAIGTIDSSDNATALKYWTGTRTQYEAIATKDDNTLYNITDDVDVTLNLLEALYPVGSLYLTTASTCPLATLGVGTWILEAADRVLQGAGARGAVGTTVDESLPNITGEIGRIGWNTTNSGSLYSKTSYSSMPASASSTGGTVNFDASRSSSTYQDGAPVQQNAYIVNVFRRLS